MEGHDDAHRIPEILRRAGQAHEPRAQHGDGIRPARAGEGGGLDDLAQAETGRAVTYGSRPSDYSLRSRRALIRLTPTRTGCLVARGTRSRPRGAQSGAG